METQSKKQNKKIYILNGVGTSGKGEFATRLNKYVSTHQHSIVDLVKTAAHVLGWNGGKTEKDRKFLSDIVDLSSEYNDSPFRDVLMVVSDFENNLIEDEVLVIDMRDPKDIARAVECFDAKTILIRNPNVGKIESNHADRDVENYQYDYIIENDGSLEQLDKVVKMFAFDVVRGEHIPKQTKPFVWVCSKY